MARVKSKHVQNSYLWMVKLQMILILLIIFSVFYTMCIHYFHFMKIDLSVSLRRYLGLESSETFSQPSTHVCKCFCSIF